MLVHFGPATGFGVEVERLQHAWKGSRWRFLEATAGVQHPVAFSGLLEPSGSVGKRSTLSISACTPASQALLRAGVMAQVYPQLPGIGRNGEVVAVKRCCKAEILALLPNRDVLKRASGQRSSSNLGIGGPGREYSVVQSIVAVLDFSASVSEVIHTGRRNGGQESGV